MKFRLKQFAKNELKTYQITRKAEYDMKNPEGIENVYHWEMLIYKKSLRVATAVRLLILSLMLMVVRVALAGP